MNAKGGDGVDDFAEYENEEKRRERQLRRKAVAYWKATAKAIKNGTGILQKEARHVAMTIIEDGARTMDEFKNVGYMWDEKERIERWRIDKQEQKINDAMPDNPDFIDYEIGPDQTVIPPPLDHVWWRQLLSGNFLDVIHDCPHEIQEFTSSRPVYEFTRALDESHKEILYYWAIRQWSPQRIAAHRGQTDRNVRKVYNNMIDDIRRRMYIRLHPRYSTGKPLTHTQREFCKNYWEQLDETQKSRLLRKFEEEERRMSRNGKTVIIDAGTDE